MAIYNYKNRCEYKIGDIENDIYLYEFDVNAIAMKFREDNPMNGIATNITGNGTKLYCDKATFTSDIESDNRYAFTSKLELTFYEREGISNTNLINYFKTHKLFVLFKDKIGGKYIMNPELPVQLTYNYTLTSNEEGNKLSVSLVSLSNIPVMAYSGQINFDSVLREEDKCNYNLGKVTKLKMANLRDVFFKKQDDGSIEIIERGRDKIKEVEYNEKSLQFVEEYDGDTFSQKLEFEIPFSNYLYYFHFNLLEYVNNKYYAMMYTSNGNLIVGGDRQGMFPEYTINASKKGNTIHFTLASVYHHESLLATDNSTEHELNYEHYAPVDGECINKIYTYTLLRKYMNEYATNDYVCLDGYQDRYTDKNIVATYTLDDTQYGVLTDLSVKCDVTCNISGLPSVVIFTQPNTGKTFNVTTDCALSFANKNTDCDLEWNYMTGDLLITNKRDNGRYTITCMGEDGIDRSIQVIVMGKHQLERTINVTAKRQIIDIKTSQPISNVSTVGTSLDYSANQYGNGYSVMINENKSETVAKLTTFNITYKNGDTDKYTIIQDHLYVKYINDGTKTCIGHQYWEMYLKKVGYTPDELGVDSGYVKGQLLDDNSTKCYDNVIARQDGTMCINGKTYWLVSYISDGAKVKTQLEYEGSPCSGTPAQTEWRVNTDYAVCQNGKPYYIKELWASNDGTNWYKVPNITGVSDTPSEVNVCAVIGNDDLEQYRWVEDGTICLKDDSEEDIYNCLQKERVENDYICDGFNKYQKMKLLISPLCNGNFKFYGYEKGALIEENCSDCGYVNNI